MPDKGIDGMLIAFLVAIRNWIEEDFFKYPKQTTAKRKRGTRGGSPLGELFGGPGRATW